LSEIRDNRKIQTGQSGNEQDGAQARASAMAMGFRLSSELVAGVLVGAALGWGFDRLLSTSPWGLIVFLLLGFTAGVINVMRAAGVMAKQSERL
jgi:ATP synthase protein I